MSRQHGSNLMGKLVTADSSPLSIDGKLGRLRR
ncbi:hypothetical protein BJY24_002300 [Nocardia transvalensis]|uniref:Uncharacterized protein n=1 Tax=Nocardia transvalensis TaxID=37333 RepID=A0A7W9PD38_9NOCA|nr:hypothetical protein [Nocardia transvalensis]